MGKWDERGCLISGMNFYKERNLTVEFCNVERPITGQIQNNSGKNCEHFTFLIGLNHSKKECPNTSKRIKQKASTIHPPPRKETRKTGWLPFLNLKKRT